MRKTDNLLLRLLMSVGCLAVFGSVNAVSTAYAGDMRVEARLIWGTDTTATNRLSDERLEKYLRGIFKWKNYQEITNRATSIPENQTRSVEMSSKCTLKIKNLGASRIEVNCFGDGKFVSKGVYSLSTGQWLALGGNGKDESAWFIAMRSKGQKGDSKPISGTNQTPGKQAAPASPIKVEAAK